METTNYKNQKALVVENNTFRVLVLPEIGAKIASLIYKPLNKELLTQRVGENYLTQPYAGDYLLGEGSAFDDMFPNIEEYIYDKFPLERCCYA